MQTFADQEGSMGRQPSDLELLEGGRDLLLSMPPAARSKVTSEVPALDFPSAYVQTAPTYEGDYYLQPPTSAPADPARYSPELAPAVTRTQAVPDPAWQPAASTRTGDTWSPPTPPPPVRRSTVETASPAEPVPTYVDSRGRSVRNAMPAGPNAYWDQNGNYRQTFDRGDGVQQTFSNSRTPIEAFNETGAAYR